ncbi:MAG TPA: ABC-F family ATPase [Gammaproteobacteria bacterium]|jgi:ATPase subunit of ABC transporter with duplicated ATPase domains|nr:ABC-F family ATPase [Xanthomonadales bacterium]MCB1593911.1 ABC-F family ATPase [Xanthomonadales bacterium]MCB1604269.1 ABC-F family ATPase [Xanthomonadales bacterium]HPI96101.1 ABC-F family ATPase [Gammaproteobacteria bacterium]HPQ88284.1 ABC-F family ATPase [Gammaproteobacteria bacterium]
MIVSANVGIQFGSKPLFDNISMKFGNGNRYGLIGANGCGKSTFMKILTKELQPTNGSVSYDEHDKIGVLGQDQYAFEEFSVIDTVIMGDKELWRVKEERDRIYALPEMTEEDGIKVANLETEFAEMDGYSAEARAGELLMGLEIPEEQHYGLMSEVAPGWKLRVLLAQVLFSNPDFLLLDEPTNNLDINTIRWLENTLNSRKSTMIIISHDRHFLNSVCTHMLDLDYGELRQFPGNYDEYMIAATQSKERLHAENAKMKEQMKELKHFISRFSANASKARQATSRQKQLDKIQLHHIKPSSRVNPYIIIEQEKALIKNALSAKDLSKSFDDKTLFKDLSITLEVGEKLAVIGANGIGKTTLLNCLTETIQADSGSIKWPEHANIAYFKQDNMAEFKENISAFDWMMQWKKPEDDEQAVRSVMGRLLFSKEDSKKKLNVLSGGEKGRMMFGKIMLQKPNILFMDEPTNHLDMESIESLNLALENYEGTLIFVSHDRQFVSSIATRVLELQEGQYIDHRGTYEELLAKQGV